MLQDTTYQHLKRIYSTNIILHDQYAERLTSHYEIWHLFQFCCIVPSDGRSSLKSTNVFGLQTFIICFCFGHSLHKKEPQQFQQKNRMGCKCNEKWVQRTNLFKLHLDLLHSMSKFFPHDIIQPTIQIIPNRMLQLRDKKSNK